MVAVRNLRYGSPMKVVVEIIGVLGLPGQVATGMGAAAVFVKALKTVLESDALLHPFLAYRASASRLRVDTARDERETHELEQGGGQERRQELERVASVPLPEPEASQGATAALDAGLKSMYPGHERAGQVARVLVASSP
ncbi:hypothetical protein C8K30_11570 [Promicromonospora sp. AC04]|nr:hypothetical protein C8K30_11570 [Promicromonospora sp. AC04]